jgi:predicted NBD/HSP70 family sugar kinase
MAAIGNNPERTRFYNRRVVLETVRLHGPISRAELARRTTLTAQAVSNIAADLRAQGLLVETGRRRTGRGQPPVELAVNPDGGRTIGIEVARDGLRAVLVDLGGRILGIRERPLRTPTPARVLPWLRAEVAALLDAAGCRPRQALGAGVVMPGPFRVLGLSSIGPTALPGWAEIDASGVLAQALDLPVLVENDATAAAVGERLYGVARELRTFCLVHFGLGLGLGLVLEGRPYKGAFGNAGELGHVVVVPGGRPCCCGNAGCLERYVSLHAAAEQLREAGIELAGPGGLASLLARGEPTAGRWLADAARHLRPVVQMLEHIFDPEAVVFGGALPEPVLDQLLAAMEPLPLSVARRAGRTVPRILRGNTGRLTPALGAAALPLFATVTPELGVPGAAGEPRRTFDGR